MADGVDDTTKKGVVIKKTTVSSSTSKEFGAKKATDGSPESCWMSGPGDSQWIEVRFEDIKPIRRIRVVFQGGFAAVELNVEGKTSSKDTEPSSRGPFSLLDGNLEQEIDLDPVLSCQYLRISFLRTADFYGRVAIYSLECFE